MVHQAQIVSNLFYPCQATLAYLEHRSSLLGLFLWQGRLLSGDEDHVLVVCPVIARTTITHHITSAVNFWFHGDVPNWCIVLIDLTHVLSPVYHMSTHSLMAHRNNVYPQVTKRHI